jgi:outer membrane lipoprotein-sorting protein
MKMMVSKRITASVLFLLSMNVASAQDAAATLVQKVKAKIDRVTDYEASGKMKTNVTFLKVPEADVKVYFKKPDKLKIKNEKGISFVPKGAVSINLNSILSGNQYSIIDAGTDKLNGITVRVIKLLPTDDNADVVLSTLYIDEAKLVIKKAKTTTRANGSYELEMTYGKYTEYGLPDKVVFTFNIKDYKLPKGVTFDFDDGTDAKKPADKTKTNSGRAEISYNMYIINKGVKDEMFK